ncbi:hypothetical protein Tco_1223732 [Tanacetum coccineum]
METTEVSLFLHRMIPLSEDNSWEMFKENIGLLKREDPSSCLESMLEAVSPDDDDFPNELLSSAEPLTYCNLFTAGPVTKPLPETYASFLFTSSSYSLAALSKVVSFSFELKGASNTAATMPRTQWNCFNNKSKPRCNRDRSCAQDASTSFERKMSSNTRDSSSKLDIKHAKQ